MTVKKINGYDFGCLALLGIILLAIAFPSFFNKANKAKYVERNYVGSMNRAQQAYFFEEGNFTDNIAELGLDIITETENYTNLINATLLSAINYSVSRRSELKSYVGGVFLGSVEKTGELTTFTILCEAKSPGTNRPPAPMVENGVIQCAPETVNLDGGDEQRIFIGEDWKLAYRSANYASAGEYTQAIDTAETITDDLIQVKALEVIATELVAAGKSKQALTIIEKIQAIALNLTDAGESEQALKVTRHITDESIKSKTIQAIAPYLTTSAEYEQGIQVAKTITDYEQKAKALDAIVRRLVATGNDKQAVQITKTIHYYYGSRDKAMAAIESYKDLQ
jgi:hypothetical protein